MEENKEVAQAPISATDPKPTPPMPAMPSVPTQIPTPGQSGVRIDIIFWVALVLVIFALIGGGIYYFYNTQKVAPPTPTPIETLAPTALPIETPNSSPSASPKSSPTATPSGSPKSSPASSY